MLKEESAERERRRLDEYERSIKNLNARLNSGKMRIKEGHVVPGISDGSTSLEVNLTKAQREKRELELANLNKLRG